MFGANTQKSLRSILLPTDARHVLKFGKDPSRDVDAIDSQITKSSKQVVFGPKFLWGGGPKNMLQQFVTAVYPYCVAKFA